MNIARRARALVSESAFEAESGLIARSLEQIIYLIESITEDIIYVAEAKDIRHADNRLAIEKEQQLC